MPTTPAEESYLKAMYHLRSGGGVITTSAIASRLGVASPSVSAMLKRLETGGLVRRESGHHIELTPEGEQQAMRMVRRHRLLETMLHQLLGVPWHELHDDAEALEHAVSDRLETRIAAALGHPNFDPHGDPIPPADLAAHRETWPDPLSDAPVRSYFRVERVSDRNADALHHLAEMGIVPGAVLWLEQREPFDAVLWIRTEGRNKTSRLQALGPTLTALIHGTTMQGRARA